MRQNYTKKGIILEIIKACGFWAKFAGFMLKKDANYGLLFENCRSVHTFFMRFNLDIAFFDKNNRLIAVKRNVKPWRIVLPVKEAVSILEVSAAKCYNFNDFFKLKRH